MPPLWWLLLTIGLSEGHSCVMGSMRSDRLVEPVPEQLRLEQRSQELRWLAARCSVTESQLMAYSAEPEHCS